MELLAFMAAPIAMCFVLVGIHVQLGLHVVRRGVIFVDIALAQASALGVAAALALGVEPESPLSSVFGVAAALILAGIIALTRVNADRVPQEAFIGIGYVVAAAGTLLLLTRLPHGGEDIETLMVGSILWVDWGDVLRTAILYGVIAVVLIAVRKGLDTVTEDPARARGAGYRIGWWDFLFYALIGVVVTRSVPIAGVLLVFTFLVVPAVMATLAVSRHRLLVGWGLGAAIAAAGAVASYLFDLPTGATIVVLFGVTLSVQGVVHRLRRSSS